MEEVEAEAVDEPVVLPEGPLPPVLPPPTPPPLLLPLAALESGLAAAVEAILLSVPRREGVEEWKKAVCSNRAKASDVEKK